MKRRLLLLVLLPVLCGQTPSRLSRITFARGEIFVTHAGETKPAESGQILYHDDMIRTGKDSYAEVMVQNVGVFRLAENSELKLEELQSKDKTIIRLDKGKAGFFLLKIPSKEQVQVRLPTAVAGVRGTNFLVSAEKGSKVALFGGAVQMEDAAKKSVVIDKPGEITLKAGESLANKKVEKLSAESIADMKKLEEMLPLNLQSVPQDPGRMNQTDLDAPQGSDLKKP